MSALWNECYLSLNYVNLVVSVRHQCLCRQSGGEEFKAERGKRAQRSNRKGGNEGKRRTSGQAEENVFKKNHRSSVQHSLESDQQPAGRPATYPSSCQPHMSCGQTRPLHVFYKYLTPGSFSVLWIGQSINLIKSQVKSHSMSQILNTISLNQSTTLFFSFEWIHSFDPHSSDLSTKHLASHQAFNLVEDKRDH